MAQIRSKSRKVETVTRTTTSTSDFGGGRRKRRGPRRAMSFRSPVPCEQGAADLWATTSSADLRFVVCVSGVLDYELVVLCLGFGNVLLCFEGPKVHPDSLGWDQIAADTSR